MADACVILSEVFFITSSTVASQHYILNDYCTYFVPEQFLGITIESGGFKVLFSEFWIQLDLRKENMVHL